MLVGASGHKNQVHGGIRHLENFIFLNVSSDDVHGGIRHLEIKR